MDTGTICAPPHTLPCFHRDTRRRLVQACCDRLTQSDMPKFYALAVCGNSGFVGAMVAQELDLELIAVRKDTDTKSHDNRYVFGSPRGESVTNTVNGYMQEGGSYLFFDDLISSGRTFLWARDQIKKYGPKVSCAGAFAYNDTVFGTRVDLGSWVPGVPGHLSYYTLATKVR